MSKADLQQRVLSDLQQFLHAEHGVRLSAIKEAQLIVCARILDIVLSPAGEMEFRMDVFSNHMNDALIHQFSLGHVSKDQYSRLVHISDAQEKVLTLLRQTAA